MIGTYTFSQAGEVICRSQNLLTTDGKRTIQRFLAGQVPAIGRSMAFGTGSQTAVVGDKSLQFEFVRSPIDFVSPDLVGNLLIFKATLPQEVVGRISEAGLWTRLDSGIQYGSRMLLIFDANTEPWTGTGLTFVTDSTRIGGDSVRLTAALSTTVTGNLASSYIDLSGYSNTDQLSFAFDVKDTRTSTIKLRLKVDSSNYYEYVVTTPAVGYTVLSFVKSNFTAVGTPDWGLINSVDLLLTATAVGTAVVEFDGLRIEDRDTADPDYVLISRTVLGSPITKLVGAPLEVEYTLDITL